MSHVFVLDTNKHPLNPVHPGYARRLLKQARAAIWRRFPFTIILKSAVAAPRVEPLRIKLDPGSRTTGIAYLSDTTGAVVFAAELSHRGHTITEVLATRRAVRRSRRGRKTRYRKPRFANRRNKQTGWLPPSLQSRISNVLTWVGRLSGWCPITAISLELVKFDMQQMENPEISGAEYQQGTLAGYEVREYLLEKWGRLCAYCGAKNVPLEIEHITPWSTSRDDRVCNLTLACHRCNDKKGTQDICDFLADQPDLLQQILAQAKAPLKDAAAVNVTRWALYQRLQALGLPVECGSGGLDVVQPIDTGLVESPLDRCRLCGTKHARVLAVACRLPAPHHGTRARLPTSHKRGSLWLSTGQGKARRAHRQLQNGRSGTRRRPFWEKGRNPHRTRVRASERVI